MTTHVRQPGADLRRPRRSLPLLGALVMLAIWNPLACIIHCAAPIARPPSIAQITAPLLCHVPLPRDVVAPPASAPSMSVAPPVVLRAVHEAILAALVLIAPSVAATQTTHALPRLRDQIRPRVPLPPPRALLPPTSAHSINT
jgi:hypothetical protein